MRDITVVPTLLDNYTYVVEGELGAVVVDPAESSPVMRVLQKSGLELVAILNTHGHFDHVAGNRELVIETGCRVVSQVDWRSAGDGTPDSLLSVAGFEFRVIPTPGHSEDSVCYFIEGSDDSSPVVFTGDTLFVGGCGRLFTHSPEMMWASLARLAALPPETEVYCGHDYTLEDLEFALDLEPDNTAVKSRVDEIRSMIENGRPTVPSTISLELATNPFLRATDPVFRKALGLEDAMDVEVFAEVRRRKDRQ